MIPEDPGRDLAPGGSAGQPSPAVAGRQAGLRHDAASSAGLAFPARTRGPGAGTGGTAADYYPCVTCHARSHAPGTREAGHDYQPPRRVGHHAEGVGADGRLVVHPGMAGEVLADFPYLDRKDGDWVRPEHDGLGQALEWAGRVLASDPTVETVTIRRDVQEFDGQPWKVWRHVQSVSRGAAAVAAGTGSTPGQATGPPGRDPTRRAAGPGGGRSPRAR